MKTLLVPLDFSNTTERVLAHAAELARPLEARIMLVHIVEPVATYVPVGASMDVIAAAPPQPMEMQDLSADEARLRSLAQPLSAAGIPVECLAVVGLAVDDILDQAAKCNASYIILGSHGHGALYHLFTGSVVNGVLKRATCPVIVVPAGKKS
jgi:nucleotide-binding universal stress UspA family protein